MLPIICILIFALGLRLIALNQSLWLDEAINVIAARDRGVLDLLTNYALGDFHPPLYHLILHYWIQIFGDSEISVRLPSVIFGLITIYFTYKISQLIFAGKTFHLKPFTLNLSLIPPLLLATSGLHLYYSQEARMYSLAAMFTTMAVYYLLRVNHKSSYRSLLHGLVKLMSKGPSFFSFTNLFLVISLVGMLYTDYVPWLLLPLFLLLAPIQAFISLALTIPWWPFLYRQLNIGLSVATNYPGWGSVVGGFSSKNIVLIPIKFLIGRTTLDHKALYYLLLLPPLLLTFTLIIYIIKVSAKAKTKSHFIVLAWLLLPLGLGILLSLKISLLSYFRFLFVLPAFYLAISLALSQLKPKLASAIFIIFIALNLSTSLAYLFIPRFHREDWRGFSNWLKTQPASDSLTVFPSLAQAAPYQYYQHTIPVTDQIDPETLPTTVYLVRYVQEIFDPTDGERLSLEKLGYTRTSVHNFNGIVVWVYQNTTRIFATVP